MACADKIRTAARCFDVKVDTYTDQNPRGRLKLEERGREIPFSGALQLILLIDEALAGEGCPDEGERWIQPPDLTRTGDGEAAKLATLAVELLFRENNSWQGRMTWVEENRMTTFRSVLELLMEMDEALGS